MVQLQVAAVLVLLVAAIFVCVDAQPGSQLSFRYYRTSCPNVERIIAAEVKKAFKKDKTIAPGILRLVFHDCFVRVRILPSPPSIPLSAALILVQL